MSDGALCPRCKGAIPDRLAACPRCLLQGDEKLVLGNVELADELGRGGMGTVYRGKHLKLGRTVAVKLLPDELARDPDFIARFEREARVLAMLDHPHVVRIHDFGQADGQSWIVMELVDGKPLSKLVPQPARRAVELLLDVSDALAYAHGRGIVHRDVKPENVLVDAKGRAKVTDFGIARLVHPDSRGWTVTAHDQAVGTVGYLAPEVLQGAAPDPRQDVYALGVLLHELVTGKRPAGAFDPPPAPLDRVVLKALAQDPAKRYPDARAFHQDLVAAGVQLAALERRGTEDLPVAAPAARALAPAAAGPAVVELEAEEWTWLASCALLLSAVTGVALWTLVESVRPKIVLEDNPVIMAATEKLPDGRILSLARFEILPMIATVAAVAVGLTGYGLIRRHWRKTGLDTPAPDRPARDARLVLAIGAVCFAIYLGRSVLVARGVTWFLPFMPLIGGGIEIVCLFFVWTTLLELARTRRGVFREWRLVLGVVLALLPPARELLVFVQKTPGT